MQDKNIEDSFDASRHFILHSYENVINCIIIIYKISFGGQAIYHGLI